MFKIDNDERHEENENIWDKEKFIFIFRQW